MTRPELHELVDIVMDARERTGKSINIDIGRVIKVWYNYMYISDDYPTLSDFTKAVQEYIKTLEHGN